MDYPQKGEYKKAQNTKSDVLVFFVHFFEGNKRLISKHVALVNELGFDTYAFNLNDRIENWRQIPISSSGQFGIKHCLTDQIETHLNLFPDQKKIIFAFSNPSASAIEAIARRNVYDIVGLICDSGPSGKFFESAIGLFAKEKKIQADWYHHNILKPQFMKWLVAPLFSLVWSPQLHKDIHLDLSRFPEGFPVLSLRGWQDQLIPPQHIDLVFERHSQLDLQNINLTDVGHLEGLKKSPHIYKYSVEKFLSQFI